MPKFKNVSPYGDLELPLIRRAVAKGEVIEVTTEQAKHLKGQDDTWQPVKDSKSAAKKAPAKATEKPQDSPTPTDAKADD